MLDNYVSITKNSIQSFINEECRIAVELLEGNVKSDYEINQKGVFKQYPNHTIEFVWKGKIAITFRPETTQNGIELVAYHMYDEHDKVTFSEGQDI